MAAEHNHELQSGIADGSLRFRRLDEKKEGEEKETKRAETEGTRFEWEGQHISPTSSVEGWTEKCTNAVGKLRRSRD